MARKVMKFGGSSLGTKERRARIADFVANEAHAGHEIVVVPSAFGDETDDLLEALRAEVGPTSNNEAAALDEILHIGERKSAAYLTILIQRRGINAVILNIHQIGLIATNEHGHARIKGITRPEIITDYLTKGYVVIIAGFQAMTEDGAIVTLGRGGSDLSAVFIAAMLNAECIFFKDVPYITLAHPGWVKNAKPLRRASLEQILPLTERGAGVLMSRAVRAAMARGVTMRVCLAPAFGQVNDGTILVPGSQPDDFEGAAFQPLTALTIEDGTARMVISGIPHERGALAPINEALERFSFKQFHDRAHGTAAKLVCIIREEDAEEMQKALAPLRQREVVMGGKKKKPFQRLTVTVEKGLVALTLLVPAKNGSEAMARRDRAAARAGSMEMVIDAPAEGTIITIVQKNVARPIAQAFAEEFGLVES